MRISALLVLFAVIMFIQVVSLHEGFGGQPGTQIQMNASRPMYFVATVPDYSVPTVWDDDESMGGRDWFSSAWWGY